MWQLFQPFNGLSFIFLPLLIIPLVLWSLIWKGLALWRAARKGSTGWFIALLLVNTAGILEILYLLVFSKEQDLGNPNATGDIKKM
jgi:methionyl-tRNA synthetase